MFQRILDRMVERAVPPFIEDPAQERIAVEAAENGIRQTAWVAGLAGGFLLAVIAGMLYLYLPSQQIALGPTAATRAAPQPGAEKDANLRHPVEDLQKTLDEVTQERDTLQGKVTDLEGQVAEVKSKLRHPSEDDQRKLDDVTKERDTLQGKLAVLEGQVAELNRKLKAAQALAAPKNAPQLAKQATRPARAPVVASRPSSYQCGDGRTVRNPVECKPAHTAAPGPSPSTPSTYQCGDGRTVRNPAECKPAPGG